MQKLFKASVLFSLLIGLGGCSLTLQKPSPQGQRVDTNIPAGHPSRSYEVVVRYFILDKLGIPQSVDEARADVTHVAVANQGHYYRWGNYQFRSFRLKQNESPVESGMEYDQISSDDHAPWKSLEEVNGFTYFIEQTIVDKQHDGGQIRFLPNLNFVRKNIDGFRFYLQLIDFHMWDIYADFTRDFKQKGDVFQVSEEGHTIRLDEWPNVIRDLNMQGGTIYIESLGNSEFKQQASKLYYFQQNQRLESIIIAPLGKRLALKLPQTGSNRFMGYYETDMEDRVLFARFNEYFHGKIDAPLFINAPNYAKREYILRRVK